MSAHEPRHGSCQVRQADAESVAVLTVMPPPSLRVPARSGADDWGLGCDEEETCCQFHVRILQLRQTAPRSPWHMCATHLLQKTLQRLVRDLAADLAAGAHAHEDLLNLLRELGAGEGYPGN